MILEEANKRERNHAEQTTEASHDIEIDANTIKHKLHLLNKYNQFYKTLEFICTATCKVVTTKEEATMSQVTGHIAIYRGLAVVYPADHSQFGVGN